MGVGEKGLGLAMVEGRHTGSCCYSGSSVLLAGEHMDGVRVTSPVRKLSFRRLRGDIAPESPFSS